MRNVVMNVMVRLEEADVLRLESAQLPGESRNATMLRLLAQGAGTDPLFTIYYRKPPVFKTWMSAGPYPVLVADDRARAYVQKGFAVELVKPGDPPPKE